MVVRNAGIDWSSPDNCYWQHKVARKEAARIVLHGQSEFEASHVVLEGDQTFEVSPLSSYSWPYSAWCASKDSLGIQRIMAAPGIIDSASSQNSFSLGTGIWLAVSLLEPQDGRSACICQLQHLLRRLLEKHSVPCVARRCRTATRWWCQQGRQATSGARCSLCTSGAPPGSGTTR